VHTYEPRESGGGFTSFRKEKDLHGKSTDAEKCCMYELEETTGEYGPIEENKQELDIRIQVSLYMSPR